MSFRTFLCEEFNVAFGTNAEIILELDSKTYEQFTGTIIYLIVLQQLHFSCFKTEMLWLTLKITFLHRTAIFENTKQHINTPTHCSSKSYTTNWPNWVAKPSITTYWDCRWICSGSKPSSPRNSLWWGWRSGTTLPGDMWAEMETKMPQLESGVCVCVCCKMPHQ